MHEKNNVMSILKFRLNKANQCNMLLYMYIYVIIMDILKGVDKS